MCPVKFLVVPRFSVAPIRPYSSPVAPPFRPYGKWQALRNSRNVRYWELGRGGPEEENRGCALKGGYESAVDSFERSVGFRGPPRLDVVPILPQSSPSTPNAALLQIEGDPKPPTR